MPNCNKCGKELTLRAFERYKEDEESYTYACETEGCSLEGKRFPFSEEEEE